MRSLQLQAALTEYLRDAAGLLQADVASGAEVRFELEQQRRRWGSVGPALSCYRPLTDEFLAERDGALERPPSYAEAVSQLNTCPALGSYLASVGADPQRADGRVAMRAIVREVFAEQTDFELRAERVSATLARLEHTALASSSELTLVATLHGLTITSPQLELATGLTLAHPAALTGLPASVQPIEGEAGEHLVVLFSGEDPDPAVALSRGRDVLCDLLRALRLFGDGRVSLGALAWARVGGGAWNPLALGAGGRPHGMLVVTSEQEDELRAFCSLVSRRAPDGNEIAWALRRFELGCERESCYEALTDHVLALRALLEPEGPSSGLLAMRLAALCATPERRLELSERTAQALVLEREAVLGTAVAHAGGEALARDLADNLRALLRDVICGHLAPDLIVLADELLLQSQQPPPVSAAPLVAVPSAPPPYEAAPEVIAASAPPPASAASAEQPLRDPREGVQILDVFI
jgi:hypothetical protein